MNIFNKKPFLIGEIGLNFRDVAKREGISDIDAAKLMIKNAKSCGVDAVNFYSFKLENITVLPQENELDTFGEDEFKVLAKYCDDVGIKLIATPFDFESVDFLSEIVDVLMISSGDLTNIPFIKYVACKTRSILLSTGGATIREVKEAVNAIEEVSIANIAVMHSVLSTHASFEDANLLMIKDLINYFPNYEIGYSDYIKSDDNVVILTTAFNYGAVILNKPFSIDKSLEGNTHFCSMDANDVAKFKDNLKFLSMINGFSIKQPLVCESSARRELRKSIVAKRDIKKGEVLSLDDIAFKRPGDGISPSQVDDVIGKTASKKIKKDTLLNFEMFD